MDYKIIIGDCLYSMQSLPDQSVQTCVTSPPYFGLRNYGNDQQIGLEQTPDEFVNKLVDVFREVRRVLKNDGTLWLNLGDSYCGVNGYARASEKFQRKGRNDAPANNRSLSALHKANIKTKDLIGIPWRVAFALQADGWYLRQDIIWSKPNPMPEPVKDRCTKSHEYIFLLSKSPKYYYDHEAIKEDCSESNIQDFMKRKTLNNKGKGLGTYEEARPDLARSRADYMPSDLKRNKRSVWEVTPKPYSGAHFAVYPPELIEPCILAATKKGDTVLDPFGGSGTTAGVALKHKRKAILCELNPEYASIVDDRIKDIFHDINQYNLLDILED